MKNCVFFFIFLISHLTAEDPVGYFWHFTDFHLDQNFTNPSTTAHNSRDYFIGEYRYDICWTGEAAGRFGDYDCDSSIDLIRSAIQFANQTSHSLTDGQVYFALWTGDDTSHASDEHFSIDTVLQVIQNITDELSVLDFDIYPVLGNHDAHFKNQLAVDPNDFLYEQTGAMWQDWLKTSGTTQYTTQCGVYSLPPDQNRPFRLVGLNTNLLYKSNNENQGLEDPCGQLGWLDQTLSNATNEQEKVILFAHVPPGKFERFYQYYSEIEQHGFPWFTSEFNNDYLDLITSHADVIESQLYGHHHTDSFKVVKDSNGQASSYALIAPAVSPWRSTLAPETGANNPGLRLFKYNLTSGQILDYDQFWLNLTDANVGLSPQWKREYTFSSYFGGSRRPSTESVLEMVESLLTDEELFKKYYAANTVQYEYATPETCDQTCHLYHYCAMAELDYQRFEQCVTNQSPGYLRLEILAIAVQVLVLLYAL